MTDTSRPEDDGESASASDEQAAQAGEQASGDERARDEPARPEQTTGDERVAPDDGPFAPAIDCHVHLMPGRLMRAIRNALAEEAGWGFPHPTDRAEIEATLRAAGVERYVALPYAHRPGIAADLNDWVLARADESEMVVPFATVHGDDDVRAVVRSAFEAGARGLKFQCPVQKAAPDDPRLDPAYELCAEYDRSVLFHAGTAPMFEDSPYVGVERFRSFIDSYPDIRACCAHMGTYETEEFVDVVRDHDRAYLDTAYVLGEGATSDLGIDPIDIPDAVFEELSESIMFGSDYPNTTFPYSDGVEGLLDRDISRSAVRDISYRTPERFVRGD